MRYALYVLLLALCVPFLVASPVFVALLLRASWWDGRSGPFGNSIWGRGSSHPSHPTRGFWQEFNWLVLRNPVHNLLADRIIGMAVSPRPYTIKGDPKIGDKTRGGCYRIRMGLFWEYYLVWPYSLLGRRCVRVRLGWKILDSKRPCALVFTVNPVKRYEGI